MLEVRMIVDILSDKEIKIFFFDFKKTIKD